jgi:hypothetical protein
VVLLAEGVAHSSGRITLRPDGLFDADQAMAEWEASTLHERGHDNRNNGLEILAATDLPLENERPANASDYAKARLAVQIFEARLKKLRYEETCASVRRSRCCLPDSQLFERSLREYPSQGRAAGQRDGPVPLVLESTKPK